MTKKILNRQRKLKPQIRLFCNKKQSNHEQILFDIVFDYKDKVIKKIIRKESVE